MRRIIIASGAALLTGCSAPSATHTATEFHGLNLDTAHGEVRFEVRNPWPVGLEVTGLSYELQVADRPVLTGLEVDGFRVDRWDQVEVALPITLHWGELREAALSPSSLDEVPWSVRGTLGISTWFGERQIPLRHDGSIPVLQRPRVAVEEVRFGRGAEGGIGLAMELSLRRPGGMRWGVEELGWTFALSESPVAAGRAATRIIDPSTTALRLEVLVDPFHAARQTTALLLGYPVPASIHLLARFTTPLGSFPLDTTLSHELRWR